MKADNPFKSKLYNHTLPVAEGSWEAIEKRLPPEKTERRFPIFWLVLFACTIVGGSLMFGFIDKPEPVKTTPPAYTLPAEDAATAESNSNGSTGTADNASTINTESVAASTAQADASLANHS